ncbi:MAG: hypothetical protein OXG65_09490 [Chloroflexi bacterium]|nr:hypothetical protein [Chloroflexota bacterium]
MTAVPVREPPLTRSDLRGELDRTLKHYGMKAYVGDLKVWNVGLLLIVVMDLLWTARAMVAALPTRKVTGERLTRRFSIYRCQEPTIHH